MDNEQRNRLDETRKLDAVEEQNIIGNKRSDIEIEDTKTQIKSEKKPKFWQKKRVRICALLAVFVFALGGGFYLSSYYHAQRELAENDALHQKQELKKKEVDLENQRQQLQEERRQLEREKENVQNSGSSGLGSWLSDTFSSITDKGSNDTSSATKTKDNSQIDEKIAKAQGKIDQINNNISKLLTGDNIDNVQQKLNQVYYDNKDLIDLLKTKVKNFLE